MEFLIVTESKLKIMLSDKELAEYGISDTDGGLADPRVRAGVSRLLSRAREECGFSVGQDKVLVQLYPSREGNELFVTKLGLLSSSSERVISGSGRVAVLAKRRTGYKFSSKEDIEAVMSRIDGECFDEAPRIFKNSGGEYYLIINERRAPSDKGGTVPFISEYATEIPERLCAYIIEHGEELEELV